MRFTFTQEQIDYLRNQVGGRTKQELTEVFNQQFQMNLTVKQISACCRNHKLPRSGLTGYFEKGHVPFNKGTKGLYLGGKETQFKKGNRPKNYKPVGSERMNVYGYMEVKVEDPNKWITKHAAIWEEENGPVPKGKCVIFGDGNRQNFDLDNLLLVSRQQLAMLNKHALIKDDAELTKTGIIVTDLLMKMSERKKALKEK